MKKTLSYFLLILVMVIFVSACSSGEDATSEDEVVLPEAPLTLRADAGNGEVTLEWNITTDAKTYNIYYIDEETVGTDFNSTAKPSATVMKEKGTLLTNVSAPLKISGLKNGIEYWFTISAVNPEGEGELAEAIAATPSDNPSMPAPKNVRANAGNAVVTVRWDPVVGAEYYIIYMYTYFEGTTLIAEVPESDCTTTPCSYTVTDLTNDTIYFFWVTAETIIGKSKEVLATPNVSGSVSDKTTATEGSYPSLITSTTVGDEEVTIDWTNPTGAPVNTTYNLYCYQNSGGTLANMMPSLTAGPQTLSDLTNGTEYYFYLKSVLQSSLSSFDYATPSETPPPPAPVLTEVTAGSTSATQIYLKWTAVSGTGTISYKIYYGPSMGIKKDTGVEVVVGSGTQGYMTNLTKGVTYYFVVTATDDNGESTESNEVSVVPTVDPA